MTTQFELGLQHTQTGQYHEAVECFTQALQQGSEDESSILYFRTIALFAIDEYALAMDDCNTLIKTNPRCPFPYRQRGEWLLHLQQNHEALQDLSTAIALFRAATCRCGQCTESAQHEEPETVYRERATAYQALSLHKEAIGDLSEAIHLNDQDYLSFSLRGISHAILGDDDSALSDFAAAIDICPTDTEALWQRSWFYRERNLLHESLSDLNHLLGLAPDHYEALFARAVIHFDFGRNEDAIQDVSHGLSLAPESVSASGYQIRGFVEFSNGAYYEAIQDFDEYVRRGGASSSLVHEYRGRSRKELEDYSGAIDDLTKALQLDDTNLASICQHRAECYQRSGDIYEALKDIQAAISAGYKPPGDCYLLRGLCMAVLPNQEAAIEEYSRLCG